MITSDLNESLIPNKEEKITVAHIFKLNANELQELFKKDNLDKSEGRKVQTASLKMLRDHGSVQGMLRKLATDDFAGISGDDNDLKRRKKFFG